MFWFYMFICFVFFAVGKMLIKVPDDRYSMRDLNEEFLEQSRALFTYRRFLITLYQIKIISTISSNKCWNSGYEFIRNRFHRSSDQYLDP